MSERIFGMALGAVFCAFFFAFLFALGGCASVQTPAPCDQAPSFAKWEPSNAPKRKIAFNKRSFSRSGFTAQSFNAFGAKMGLKGVRGLEGINGFSYDVDASAASVASSQVQSTLGPDWVVQDELEHHVFETLYRLTPVEVNSGQPSEPRPPCPGPSPTPDEPRPDPEPIEQAKSWGVTRVRAMEAKAKVDTSKVRVGIVDTGLDLQHECLGTVVATKSFTGEAVSPDPGQHGTHVAGTVAGKCGVGVSRAGIVFGKGLMNNGSGSSTQLAQAVAWVCSQGIKVASFSWGSSQSDPLINQAIAECTQKGIAVVIANGNDSKGTLNWPAALSKTNALVFGVAASDKQDRKASFSTYGTGTKFIAPGVDIISNKPGGGTQKMSGTSMATPHVAGALAYCAALNKPFQSCMKTDDLGLGVTVQGAGLPRLDSL